MADARWRKTLRGLAVEEMLALVSNLMAAIGAARCLAGPTFRNGLGTFPPSMPGFRHRALGGAAGVDS